jgi:hypothetical protein
MRRSLVALTAATTIAVAAVATPSTADARWRRGGWWGPALGGFALGALVGSAFRDSIGASRDSGLSRLLLC